MDFGNVSKDYVNDIKIGVERLAVIGTTIISIWLVFCIKRINFAYPVRVFFLDKTEVKENKLTICGTDKSNLNKQIALSIQDIISAMDKHGNPNF